ncbi:MAG TPA: aspartate/glutamate racemase family protein [Longimicrobiaceae bacterium]|nr:aspartate/glutamate racemase family protein [Longimicrobiaceae bacterium]
MTAQAAARRERVGVLGGMGPLASAEFLRTIYEHGEGEREQELPVVMLYSDPTFPDRSESFLAGRPDALLARLTAALGELEALGVDRVVICCVTLHHLLPRLPARLSGRVVSLVDVACDELERRERPHLLVCTAGTRAMRVFESHPRWERVRHLVRLPEAADQQRVHDWIYGVLKRGGDREAAVCFLRGLLARYEVGALLAGCTDLHLLVRSLARPADGLGPVDSLDPLVLIAGRIASGALHGPVELSLPPGVPA